MVVDELNVRGVPRLELEDDPVLVVHSDAVEPRQIAVKLLQPIGGSAACTTFVCHAAVGPVSGTVMLGLISCFYLALVVITLMGYPGREPSVEVLSRERTLQKLVSPLQQPVNRRPWQHESPAYAGADDRDRPPED